MCAFVRSCVYVVELSLCLFVCEASVVRVCVVHCMSVR